MAAIKIDRFHGIAPRQHPSQLADGMAIVANNVKLKNGKLVPLRMPSVVSDISMWFENGLDKIGDARTMHAWKKRDGSIEFIMFPGITWMSEGNVADDERNRVIISGDTGVQFIDNSVSPSVIWDNTPVVYMRNSSGAKVVHVLAKNPLPKPVASRVAGSLIDTSSIVMKGYKTVAQINAMTPDSLVRGWTYYTTDSGDITMGDISVAAGSQIIWDGNAWVFYSADYNTVRYTNFFLTWVDEYGYESPVSEASDEVVYNDGDQISIAAIGAENWPSGAVALRAYKVITGTSVGSIQFMKEVSGATVNYGALPFSIMVKDEDAGEVLTEIEAPPPDIRCILDVPGAYYCGYSPTHPKTVCFSDVDLIYSWPVAYRYDIKDNIVALAVTSNSVFALTDGWPYVLNGTDPSGMTVSKLAGPAACVSQRGVCVYKNAVYYVGNQGLMIIYNDANAGTVCANLTEKVFTKDQWLSKNPQSCVMGQFDGTLYMFFTHVDGTHEGLSIDLSETVDSVTTHDEVAKCVCTDNKTDKLYFVREGL